MASQPLSIDWEAMRPFTVAARGSLVLKRCRALSELD